MSIDSPLTMSREDLPAELQHSLDRAPDALYYRQVELIQATMTDQEREVDDEFRANEYLYWKMLNGVIGTLTEHDDLERWKEHCENAEKNNPFSTKEGLESQRENFMRDLRATREERQLADIEQRKKKLFALDPTNIFLRAQQQEEEKAHDADELNPNVVIYRVPDWEEGDDDLDEEEEGSDTAATDSQQSLDNQAVHTPPPPPRPGNAQLPPQPTNAGIGMTHMKYAPLVPSKLRHVEEMSPLHNKENEAPSLRRDFENVFGPHMEDNKLMPGSFVEPYYYGEEDPVKDLEDAYAGKMGGMPMGMEF